MSSDNLVYSNICAFHMSLCKNRDGKIEFRNCNNPSCKREHDRELAKKYFQEHLDSWITFMIYSIKTLHIPCLSIWIPFEDKPHFEKSQIPCFNLEDYGECKDREHCPYNHTMTEEDLIQFYRENKSLWCKNMCFGLGNLIHNISNLENEFFDIKKELHFINSQKYRASSQQEHNFLQEKESKLLGKKDYFETKLIKEKDSYNAKVISFRSRTGKILWIKEEFEVSSKQRYLFVKKGLLQEGKVEQIEVHEEKKEDEKYTIAEKCVNYLVNILSPSTLDEYVSSVLHFGKENKFVISLSAKAILGKALWERKYVKIYSDGVNSIYEQLKNENSQNSELFLGTILNIVKKNLFHITFDLCKKDSGEELIQKCKLEYSGLLLFCAHCHIQLVQEIFQGEMRNFEERIKENENCENTIGEFLREVPQDILLKSENWNIIENFVKSVLKRKTKISNKLMFSIMNIKELKPEIFEEKEEEEKIIDYIPPKEKTIIEKTIIEKTIMESKDAEDKKYSMELLKRLLLLGTEKSKNIGPSRKVRESFIRH